MSKIPKEQWAINIAGTRAKSKIMTDHQSQQHAKVAVPSLEGYPVKTVMTQPVKVPPPQTIQIIASNDIN